MLPALLLASFLAQTHVALVPLAAALIAVVIGSGIVRWTFDQQHRVQWRRAVLAGGAAFVLAWALPVREALSTHDGNFVQLYRFFTDPAHRPQRWPAAWSSWSELIVAFVTPWFSLPVGWGFGARGFRSAAVAAAVVSCALLWIAIRDRRRGPTFTGAYGGVLLVACVMSLWSIQRVDIMFDHSVFWITAIGALSVSLVVGELVGALGSRVRAVRLERMTAIVGVGVVLSVATMAGRDLVLMRRGAISASRTGTVVGNAASSFIAYCQRHGIRRPLIRIDHAVWTEAVGVVLQLYKRDIPIAVERDWLPIVGAPLAPTGSEDGVVLIAPSDRCGTMEQPIFRQGPICLIDGPS